jgi:hypothetical protein
MTRPSSTNVAGVRPDAATVGALYDIISGSGSRSLAVVGLVKNAGKTTVVNALMANCPHLFGLTSLGLDGERTDHLTGLAKPSIAPPAGTLVATTRGSLERSRYAMEALEELPFHTPLGRVVIGRAAGDGAVEVSGPTTLAELRVTVERLQALGAEQVIVDGAINRIGSASPRVSDGVVVATGGMVGDTLGVAVTYIRSIRTGLMNEAKLGRASDDLGWDRPHPEIPTLSASELVRLPNGFGANVPVSLPGSPAFYAYRNRNKTWEMLDNLLWARGRPQTDALCLPATFWCPGFRL